MSFKGFVFLKSTKLMKPFVGGIFVRIPRCPSSAVKKLEHIFLTYILCKDRGWDQSGTVDFIVCARSLLLADVGHGILNLCRVCKQGFEDALRFLQKRHLHHRYTSIRHTEEKTKVVTAVRGTELFNSLPC